MNIFGKVLLVLGAILTLLFKHNASDQVNRKVHVAAHKRRLASGWKASRLAKMNAKSFGFKLPKGYTFVRAYDRRA